MGCHTQDQASALDVLTPLYIPGWGTPGKVAHLQPVYDIMLRVYLNTVAPKGCNYDAIHAFSIDLMHQTHLRKNANEKLDVAEFIYQEMWLSVIERKSCPYAPYIQLLLNKKFYQKTQRHLTK